MPGAHRDPEGSAGGGLALSFIGRVLHCECGSLLPIVEQNASSHGFRTCSLPRAAPASGPVSLCELSSLGWGPAGCGLCCTNTFLASCENSSTRPLPSPPDMRWVLLGMRCVIGAVGSSCGCEAHVDACGGFYATIDPYDPKLQIDPGRRRQHTRCALACLDRS